MQLHSNLDRYHSHQFDEGNPLAQKDSYRYDINSDNDGARNFWWLDF